MGFPRPFSPIGGACVLSVIQFQDGGRRSAVVSVEAQNDLLRRNASTNGRKTDLIERYTCSTENPSIRFMFATSQYYCIC